MFSLHKLYQIIKRKNIRGGTYDLIINFYDPRNAHRLTTIQECIHRATKIQEHQPKQMIYRKLLQKISNLEYSKIRKILHTTLEISSDTLNLDEFLKKFNKLDYDNILELIEILDEDEEEPVINEYKTKLILLNELAKLIKGIVIKIYGQYAYEFSRVNKQTLQEFMEINDITKDENYETIKNLVKQFESLERSIDSIPLVDFRTLCKQLKRQLY
jgi:cell fate (sporulation/competence/biofilm development) regulator YmcA (YheA/YmcA/DUF963 family)